MIGCVLDENKVTCLFMQKEKELFPVKRDKCEMDIPNSDFWILAIIFSAVGGIGIYEGYELQPALYSQPIIILGGLGYFAYKAFYLDKRKETESSVNKDSR